MYRIDEYMGRADRFIILLVMFLFYFTFVRNV